MPVKIRLMRIGARKRPFYRVVAVDERKKRTGAYLELLGTYNPLTEPHEIILKQDRIDEWIKKGAVPSDGYLRIIGKAPQRPPRKPKKEKKEETPAPDATPSPTAETPAPETDEAPAEETPAVEETPVEPATEEAQPGQPAEALAEGAEATNQEAE